MLNFITTLIAVNFNNRTRHTISQKTSYKLSDGRNTLT